MRRFKFSLPDVDPRQFSYIAFLSSTNTSSLFTCVIDAVRELAALVLRMR